MWICDSAVFGRDSIGLGPRLRQQAPALYERAAGRRNARRRAVAIHFMHYNFVRIHQSLRITPAMAAGVTAKLWSMADMVRVIEDWEEARSAKPGDRLVG